MNGSVIPAIVAIKRRRIIKTFLVNGAVSPAAAIVPENEGIRRGLIFRRMESSGVLVATRNDAYYLDEKAENTDRARRRKIMLVVMLVLLAVAATGILKFKF